MNSRPTRGEIWLVDLDPTQGSEMQKRRPAVVVNTASLDGQSLRVIVPITTWQPRFEDWLFMVRLTATAQNGLAHDSGANTLQVRCVSTMRLKHKLGVLSDEDLDEVLAGVAIVLEL